MHIALLNDDRLLTSKGGAAVVVDRLRRALTEKGHEVTLVTTHQDSEGTRKSSDAFGKIVEIPVNYNLRKRHSYCVSKPTKVLDAIDEALKECAPDVVHAHNLHAYLTYNALTIAKKHTDRLFLTAHDTFLVSFGRVRGAAYERNALAGRGHRMRLLENVQAVGRRYWPPRNKAIKRILKETDTKVIAISDALKLFLETNGIEVTATVRNGTEVRTPVPADAIDTFKKGFGITGPTILYGGRMSEDKGSKALLKAFSLVRKQCPDAQLLLVGDPERISASLDIMPPEDRQAVVLAGWLSQEHMRTAYAAATVVTTPSVYLDPFNLMNIEAMAEGTPVVGTCFGGTPETVVNGSTGFIRNPHETEEYAKALVSILSNSEMARTMGDASLAHVTKEFTLEKQAEEYLNLYS